MILENSTNNKRIAKNTLLLYFRMILTMVVSLYTSRVVLNTLGITDFGIYNVVGGVVTMFGFLSGAMSTATQRFLSFELGRDDMFMLRKTFNATQNIHIGIAITVLLLAETVGLWFLNNYLNLPVERMEAARWIYHFSVLAFIVSIIQVPYNAVILARERMSIYAYVSILEISLKLIVVFLLTWILLDKLILYGILLFTVSVIIAIIYRVYVRRNFGESRFLIVNDIALYRTLASYSGWNLFGGTAMIARGQGVSILLNVFFGTTVNAAQGIANQVSGSINAFVSSFQMASNPQIIKSYAIGERTYMTNLVSRTAKFSFYLVFILTLPIVLEIDQILKIWLKIVPEYAAIFTVLILINTWIDSFSGPLITAVHATGRIKRYQIAVGMLFMLNLPLSYLLFHFGFSAVSAFFFNIIITGIIFVVRLLFTKFQISEFSARAFIVEVLVRNIPVILISVLLPFSIIYYMESSIIRLFLVIIVSGISSALAIYFIGLHSNERQFVRSAILSSVNKIK